MRYLLIASQLGFKPSGELVPGGLQQFGRCVARVLASSFSIKKRSVWFYSMIIFLVLVIFVCIPTKADYERVH